MFALSFRTPSLSVAFLALSLLMLSGCAPVAESKYSLNEEVLKLDQPLQVAIRAELDKYYGTPLRPKMADDASVSLERLRHGADLFRLRCAGCHGVTGDGAGVMAEHLDPRPRDYRKGLFKFTSTPYSSRPRREDLVRFVKNGARGTSMPSFALLADEDLQDIVDYVLVLTHRGELEGFLALEADEDGSIDPEKTPELIADTMTRWVSAKGEMIWPVTKEIPNTPESVERGRAAFMSETAGCVKCHGEDARGMTEDNLKGFTDSWGRPTRAADLTSGMFHGGDRSIDIYWRIYGGIKGSPMPEFAQKLADKPDTFWDIVHFVESVSNRRREAVMKNEDFAPAAPPSTAIKSARTEDSVSDASTANQG